MFIDHGGTDYEACGMEVNDTSGHPNLWTHNKGVVKIKQALLREVPEYPDNPFIIRTMACVADSRGTEFIFASDLASETVHRVNVDGCLDHTMDCI